MGIGSVFISHKHKDREIARVVGDFIRDSSGNRVEIYLSSDPSFKGPRGGEVLREELEKAIIASGVVILVYTGKSAKVDWEYCIYECAFARSQEIRVIIFQCVDQAPAPFLGTVRNLVTEEAEVHKFAKDFLTKPDFFRNQQEPVTQYSESDPKIKEKALDLHKDLQVAFQKHLGREPRAWSAWPSLRLKMTGTAVERVGSASGDDRLKKVKDELLSEVVVTDSVGADQIFGIGIDDNQKFGALVESWRESFSESDMEWLNSVAGQVDAFARRRFHQLRAVRMPEVQGKSSVIPVVTTMRQYPVSGDQEFDLNFFDIQPRSSAVREVMISRKDFYSRQLDDGGQASMDLMELFRDMKKRNINRLPVVDQDWRILYMVHRSVITEFLLDRQNDNPTLQNLIDDPKLQETLGSTIGFVPESSTVEEARAALSAIPRARDIFVTQNGGREEPVLGMVTNIDLERLT